MLRTPNLGRVCAVVAAATAGEFARQLCRARLAANSMELRLDWLRNDAERRRFLEWLARHPDRGALIATCRRREAGGRYPGGVSGQSAILDAAVRAGCHWYDIEIESLEARGPRFEPPGGPDRGGWPAARAIVSLHRFRRFPSDPAALLRRFRIAPGAIWKLAALCANLREAATLVRLAAGRPMIVVPMGPRVFAARLLSLRQGSLLTYAAVDEQTAPGQPGLEEIRGIYRAGQIDRRTRIYGIVGDRAGHSVSPAMHNAAFQARRLNALYLPFPVTDLRDFLAVIEPFGICGFSVTIPHKQAILPCLATVDRLARRIGAVNTVVVRRGRLHGYNTDYGGVLKALEGRLRLDGCRALVVGAGGAARAAAFALADSGARVSITARRLTRARALARAAGAAAVDRGGLRRQSYDLIVNATPLGMAPNRDSPLDREELNAPLVFDMVYRPLETPLLRLAARRGLRAIAGLDMLVAQGAAQWALWTGERAPVAQMRRAAIEAIGRGRQAS